MPRPDGSPIRRNPDTLPPTSGLQRTVDTQHGLTVTRLRPALEQGQRLGIVKEIGGRQVTVFVRSAEVSRRAPLNLDVLNVGTPKADVPSGDE